MSSKVKYSAILLAVYTVLYFGVALMVSATFKDLAATEIAGAPIAIWGGLVVIIVGVVITRLYLKKMDGEESN
ncbi:DUF485 domain-containing protein [Thiomicrorhabdus sp. 6S2-11]|jgi:uncharacterized membrane protein (DUF485 family)|uniref:DUF485 domain-containing protein n=1 Tax=Thiomicrorhabdus marina TaxID=2818442 RepID=A0ABS3Q3H1_9GAMM|nr:DUF485 domain-containing protein [Thiomicrorhabdus marina]MBO1926880.1 DUF485 domain-containing protein [Thiomicrorhabdus marina]